MGRAEPGSRNFIRKAFVANDTDPDSKIPAQPNGGSRVPPLALRAGGNFNPVLGLTAYC
jgi:hypothetical protein